ncbi:hypothetical protein BJ508DRAFT_312228 [Ascobolus immersus RN42]|uniref:Uncharacterized protein n=1 Tax=Ascobolus immersus RN42 TaxID=1160509 RepID=A0A3N4HMY2_ASCIM|nr:hypothetical protein BJ508DRAFT_312228 [Ascobolus immersus RN42]
MRWLHWEESHTGTAAASKATGAQCSGLAKLAPVGEDGKLIREYTTGVFEVNGNPNEQRKFQACPYCYYYISDDGPGAMYTKHTAVCKLPQFRNLLSVLARLRKEIKPGQEKPEHEDVRFLVLRHKNEEHAKPKARG